MPPSLVRDLRAIVGEAGIVEDAARLLTYESDALPILSRVPDLVCLPRNTQEAAAVMRALHRVGVPVVARGAGTGLSGGATPVEGGVVVGTARMRDLLELDPVDRFARAQAGLVNAELDRAGAPHGLRFGPDPSSQKVCTLGGNLGENASGAHGLRYGSTAEHVLGLVAVDGAGEVIDLSQPAVDPLGYDLSGLFAGSEGTFALATEVTVRLIPAPESIQTLLGIFGDLESCCDCVSDIVQSQLEPAALEILDRLTIEAVESSVLAAGYPLDAEAVLLAEVEGSRVEVEVGAREIRAALERHGAIRVGNARDDAERAKLWAGRKGAFGAMGRVAPDLMVADVVVPRSRLAEAMARVAAICRERGLKLANVAHAGDGNLHPNIGYDRRDPEQVARVLEAGDEIMRQCVELGGTLTGEHGVGLEKLGSLGLVFDGADLRAMRAVRGAWDPEGRMNPGKLLPEGGDPA